MLLPANNSNEHPPPRDSCNLRQSGSGMIRQGAIHVHEAEPEANPRSNHPISCNRVGVLESLSIIWPFRPIIRHVPAATLSLSLFLSLSLSLFPQGAVFPPFSFHERRPAGSCDTRQCRSLFRFVLFSPKRRGLSRVDTRSFLQFVQFV